MSLPENAPVSLDNGIVLMTPELKPVSEMTDRELLEETVSNMRMVGAALAAFQEMGPAKMMASMFSSRK